MHKNSIMLMEIIKNRRSIRQFSNKKIGRAVIERIIDAGRWAPSACNLQHWLFIAIDDETIKRGIIERGKAQKQVIDAPVVIVVFCNMSVSQENYANIQSCAAAIQNMSLMAYSLGLGATWIAGFDIPENIRKLLNVPDKYRALALLMLGYPKSVPNAPPRDNIDKVLHFNQYNQNSLDFPVSVNPSKWTLEQLNAYQEKISRRGGIFEHLNSDKINEIMDFISEKISKGKILDWYSFSGIFLAKMQTINKEIYGQFMSVQTKESALMYTPGLSDNKLLFGKDKIKLQKPDTISFFYRLEHMPSKEKTLSIIQNALNIGGTAIIVTRNRISWRGLWDALHFLKNKKHGISNRYFLGLQAIGPWKFTTPFELKHMLIKAGFNEVSIHGKYLFPISEIINTETFKKKLKWLAPLCRILHTFDKLIEKTGLCNILGETLIATAKK